MKAWNLNHILHLKTQSFKSLEFLWQPKPSGENCSLEVTLLQYKMIKQYCFQYSHPFSHEFFQHLFKNIWWNSLLWGNSKKYLILPLVSKNLPCFGGKKYTFLYKHILSKCHISGLERLWEWREAIVESRGMS